MTQRFAGLGFAAFSGVRLLSKHLHALLAIGAIAACGSDDKPKSVALTAGVGGSFFASAEAPAGTSFFLAGVPDKVVAMPHYRGSVGGYERGFVKESPVSAGGEFSLELETEFDWVVFLVDSYAPIEHRICGHITVPSRDDSLVDLPISEATRDVDLGTLERGSLGDAESERDTSSVDDSFTFDQDSLNAMSQLDEGFRQVSNQYLNFDTATGVYYESNLNVGFSGNLSNIGNAEPRDYVMGGIGIGITTNDPILQDGLESICADEREFFLRPTRIYEYLNGIKSSNSTPLSTAGGSGDQNGCASEDMSARRFDDGTIYLQAGGRFIATSEGYWTLEIEDPDSGEMQVTAAFDFESSAPIVDDTDINGIRYDYPTVPVPVPTTRIDRDGYLVAIELEWVRYDEQLHDFVPVNVDALEQLVSGSLVSVTTDTANVEFVQSERGELLLEANLEELWHLPGATPAGRSKLVHEIRIDYGMGGNEYNFLWTGNPYCGDREKDIGLGEQCDRDARGGESCQTLGYGPGEISCAPTCLFDARDCEPGLKWQAKDAGSMTLERHEHRMTLLDNGKVLITGGRDANGTILDSAELYDPVAQTFSLTSPMTEPRREHTSTKLADGRVLVAGNTGIDVFDPETESFARYGEFVETRTGHQAVYVEQDGRILFVGGGSGDNPIGSARSSGEWFDVVSNQPLGIGFQMEERRSQFTATRLQNGAIAFVGGSGEGETYKTIEIAEAGSLEGSFVVAELGDYRKGHKAVLAPDGSLLIIGGTGGAWYDSTGPVFRLETFFEGERYEVGEYSTLFAQMLDFSAVALPSGHVLLTGRDNSTHYCKEEYQDCNRVALVYPEHRVLVRYTGAGAGQIGGALLSRRHDHESVLLANGNVLIAGGSDSEGFAFTAAATAELLELSLP